MVDCEAQSHRTQDQETSALDYQAEALMDENERACSYCNLSFRRGTTDKVECDARFYHVLCLEWLKSRSNQREGVIKSSTAES